MHSDFENMLFERVIAKSHEEITDKDIRDLDLDMDNEQDQGEESEQYSP